jgi:hypothetical protein
VAAWDKDLWSSEFQSWSAHGCISTSFHVVLFCVSRDLMCAEELRVKLWHMPKDSEYGISGCELRVGTKASKEILATGIPHFTVWRQQVPASYLPRWRQQVPVRLIYQDGGKVPVCLIYQDGSGRFLYVLSTKMKATGSCMSYLLRWRQGSCMSYLLRWRQQVPVCLIYQDGCKVPVCLIYQDGGNRFLYVLSTKMKATGSCMSYILRWRQGSCMSYLPR